jgi:hypothetical protein
MVNNIVEIASDTRKCPFPDSELKLHKSNRELVYNSSGKREEFNTYVKSRSKHIKNMPIFTNSLFNSFQTEKKKVKFADKDTTFIIDNSIGNRLRAINQTPPFKKILKMRNQDNTFSLVNYLNMTDRGKDVNISNFDFGLLADCDNSIHKKLNFYKTSSRDIDISNGEVKGLKSNTNYKKRPVLQMCKKLINRTHDSNLSTERKLNL